MKTKRVPVPFISPPFFFPPFSSKIGFVNLVPIIMHIKCVKTFAGEP